MVPWPGVLIVALLVAMNLAAPRPAPEPVLPASSAPAASASARIPGVGEPLLVVEELLGAAAPEVFRMPFPAGIVVMCTQGNYSAPGRTHSLPQNLHALDFASRTVREVPIVAAAPGEVAYVVKAAGDDPNAGGGYGNQVRIMHTGGLFTLYAHLDVVEVVQGQRVAAGQRLGTMGTTGLAGGRHLHFSLHRGVVDDEGVPPTLPLASLLTYEVGSAGFAPRASGDVRCSTNGKVWSGALYASENDGRVLVRGRPSVALAARIDAAAGALARSTARRAALFHYATSEPRTTASAAARFLSPLLRDAPDDPVTHYAWAVEVDLLERDFAGALRHLAIAERLAQAPELFEPWLVPWIENQRGSIALARHRRGEAEYHFARARGLDPTPEVAAFGQRRLDADAMR